MEPLVLIYNIEEEDKKNLLLDLLNEKNIAFKILEKKDLFQRLGYLAGIEGFREIDSDNLPEKATEMEIVLFANFEDDNLTDLLKTMKEKKIYIPLKAGLTQTNVNWILNDLIIHVDEENKMMKAYTAMLRDVNGIDRTVEKKSPLLTILLKEAREIGKKQEPKIEEIKNHHKKIIDEYRRVMSKDIV